MTKDEAIEYLFDIKTDAVYQILSVEEEAIDMAMDALENYDNLKKQNQWILCDKELPKPAEHSTVLVTDCEGKVSTTRAVYVITMRKVFTAWMPLPKAYEGRTDDKMEK